MNKKYELTDDTIKYFDSVLHRIRLLRPIGHHKVGELGGYIESEKNLSHEGDCMVYDQAMVYGNARVCDNAKVREYAEVSDDAMVYGYAYVHGNSQISSNARVYGHAHIHGGATVKGKVHGYASVFGTAYVGSMAEVYRYACIYGDAIIKGKVKIQWAEEYYVIRDLHGVEYTWTEPDNMWNCMGFHGTPDEFISMGYECSEETGKMFELMVRFVKDMKKI